MNPVALSAFQDEMEKISGLRDMWQGFLDLFRTNDEKVKRRVDYQFDPNASSDKWRKLVRNSEDPNFVRALAQHPGADPKLVLHAQSMGELARGKTVGKIQSGTTPGKSYEIRQLPDGRLGCQCADWRYKGSVNPGYECKHIRAFKDGRERVA